MWKIAESSLLTDTISGFLADFLRLIDVSAGGFRLKKGQGIIHPKFGNPSMCNGMC